MSTALPGQAEPVMVEEKMDKSLQKDNKKLKGEIKQMEMKIKAMQVELNKSFQMKDRLEGLCRELQKQNKFIKAESSAKIQEANCRGKELAAEVQNNMGFMKSINENLAAISSESLTVKRENEELAKKIAILKGHYEEREQILQSALKETNESLQKAKLEVGETKLKSAEEKEKLIGEMQKLADALLQSREQIKEAKETEVQLRTMIQSYEEKFNGLQKALKDTNGSYEEFRSEMHKVTGRTKEMEKETVKWQQRWEESCSALKRMTQNYQKVQVELERSQESLEKMKSLCRQLHNENKDLQAEYKDKKGGVVTDAPSISDAAAATLATITDNPVTKTDFPVPNPKASSLQEVKTEQEPTAPENKENQAPAEKITKPEAPTNVTISPAPQIAAKKAPVATPEEEISITASIETETSTPLEPPATTSTTIDANGNKPEPATETSTPQPNVATPEKQESQSDPTKGEGEGEGQNKGKKNKRKKNKK